jgi:LPXTG-motif cell wall-anchored protein
VPAATTTNPSGKPNTGDSSNIWLWAALMVASALGLRFVVLRGRRRKKGGAA